MATQTTLVNSQAAKLSQLCRLITPSLRGGLQQTVDGETYLSLYDTFGFRLHVERSRERDVWLVHCTLRDIEEVESNTFLSMLNWLVVQLQEMFFHWAYLAGEINHGDLQAA